MHHLAKLNFNARLKYYLIVSWVLLTFSSCSMVNTLERGYGKNSPSFAVTSTKRIHGYQKTGLESHDNKETGFQTRSDAKELYSSTQNIPQTDKISEHTFKGNEECVSKEIQSIEKLPQIHANSIMGNPTSSSFWGKSMTRRMNIRSKQIEKLIPIKSMIPINSNLSNTIALGFLKSFPPNGRSNSVFGPQVEFSEMGTREFLRAIGWIFIIGGPLLGLLGLLYEHYDPILIWIFLLWCLVCLLFGLFYFWAAELSENLDDHCAAYRIGFWLTVLGWPLVITLFVSIPLWIFGAFYDAEN